MKEIKLKWFCSWANRKRTSLGFNILMIEHYKDLRLQKQNSLGVSLNRGYRLWVLEVRFFNLKFSTSWTK